MSILYHNPELFCTLYYQIPSENMHKSPDHSWAILMKAKSVINKLIKAINDNKNEDVINTYIDVIADNIAEVAKQPLFYTLPFNTISAIVQKVDFNEENDPLPLMRAITAGTNKSHEKESVLLLNAFSDDKLPPLTIEQIIGILSELKSSALLTKLGDLQEEENQLLVPDYEGEITDLRKEISQRDHEIASLKQKLAEALPKDKFLPAKSKPDDFEPVMFTALTKGKLTSVKYQMEQQSFDANSLIKCFYKYENDEMKLSKTKVDNAWREIGLNPFHISCICNQVEVVQYLCEKQNINKEATDKYGKTGFIYACSKGHPEVVEYLCEKQNINKEATDNYGWTGFIKACDNGHLEVVEYLCEKQNINKEATDKVGWTGFIKACDNGHLEVVQYLCEKQNINKEATDNYGCTGFSYSSDKVREYLKSIGVAH